MEKVTLLELYQCIGEIVNKYPYYEVKIIDGIRLMGTQKIKPKIYVDREKREVYLEEDFLS